MATKTKRCRHTHTVFYNLLAHWRSECLKRHVVEWCAVCGAIRTPYNKGATAWDYPKQTGKRK